MKHACDICTAPMILKEHLGKTQAVKSGEKYRRRRFICSVPGCGYEKMVFGDGQRDEVDVPNAIRQGAEKRNRRQNKDITE